MPGAENSSIVCSERGAIVNTTTIVCYNCLVRARARAVDPFDTLQCMGAVERMVKNNVVP